MTTVFRTPRLVARRFTPADVDLLVELDGDPLVTQFINGGKPTPRDVVEHDMLPHIIADYERTPGFGRWALLERDSGTFLGWVALRRPDATRDEAELGYRLRRDAWGKGYASEAARALLRRAFDEQGVGRVWATTMTVNQRSRSVMERVGLRFVRTFFEDWPDVIPGGEQGDVEYAMTTDEWHTDGHKKAGS